jgi:succinate dehydrogenase/fumarate reductase-like Fe-S protein
MPFRALKLHLIVKNLLIMPRVVVHTYNPSTQKAKARRWKVQGQPGYIVRPCLKKIKIKTKVNLTYH